MSWSWFSSEFPSWRLSRENISYKKWREFGEDGVVAYKEISFDADQNGYPVVTLRRSEGFPFILKLTEKMLYKVTDKNVTVEYAKGFWVNKLEGRG